LLNLLIVANQAINLVLSQARKLIESARPVSKALPIMPVNDTVYFRQLSHMRRPQATSSQSAKKYADPAQQKMSKISGLIIISMPCCAARG
jgi:hypothetical protein